MAFLSSLWGRYEVKKMSDLINRADAIKLLDRERKESHPFDSFLDGILTARRLINTMPSAQPERKKGHWISKPSKKEQGERDFIWWKCSECEQVIYSESERDRKEFHAFCSRCGADMRGE